MEKVNKTKNLTIHMEGLPVNNGDLPITVFVNKLDDFKDLFNAAQNLVDSAANEKSILLIENLSHNSPAAVKLRPSDDMGGEVLNFITETIAKINKNRFTIYDEANLFIEKLLSFCKSQSNNFSRFWLTDSSKSIISIDENTITNLERLLLPTTISYGSVKGVVKKYSGDTKEKYVFLYAPNGQKIKCLCSDDDILTFSDAVEKNVTVYGKVKKRGNNYYPFEISDIYKIDVIGKDSDLPRFSDLQLDKSLLNGSDSVDLIKEIRRDW